VAIDDFNCVVALHVEPPGFSSWHRVPRVRFGTESFGTTMLWRASFGPTMLWRVTLQRRRGKSPLAIESINDRNCRFPRGVIREGKFQTCLESRLVHRFLCGGFIGL